MGGPMALLALCTQIFRILSAKSAKSAKNDIHNQENSPKVDFSPKFRQNFVFLKNFTRRACLGIFLIEFKLNLKIDFFEIFWNFSKLKPKSYVRENFF